jgi:hypothetical protein
MFLKHKKVNINKFLEEMKKCKTTPVKDDLLKSKSTQGINSFQIELTNIDELSKLFLKAMKGVIEINNLKPTSCWSVSGDEGSYHRIHRHLPFKGENVEKTNRISTVLYLDVPSKTKIADGDFYFVIKENNEIKSYSIEPKVGDFIVMSANVFHGTYPQSKGLRRTLNMDFIYV